MKNKNLNQKPEKLSRISLKNVAAIVLVVSLIIAAMFIIPSCGKNDDGDRIIFKPQNGAFEILLLPSEWTDPSLMTDSGYMIINEQAATLYTIRSFSKTELTEINASDIDGFIEYYDSVFLGMDEAAELDQNENGGADSTDIVDDLTSLPKKLTQGGSVINSGKRRLISDGNYIEERLYIESKNQYFLIEYRTVKENFDSAQKAGDELIKYIRKG